VLSADPSQAKPMGLGTVAEGGGTLSITVKTYQFSGPVDIYFGLYSPSCLFFLFEKGNTARNPLKILSLHSTGITP
jgi:hypothetical protein